MTNLYGRCRQTSWDELRRSEEFWTDFNISQQQVRVSSARIDGKDLVLEACYMFDGKPSIPNRYVIGGEFVGSLLQDAQVEDVSGLVGRDIIALHCKRVLRAILSG
jgi:hypothetical protein